MKGFLFGAGAILSAVVMFACWLAVASSGQLGAGLAWGYVAYHAFCFFNQAYWASPAPRIK